MNEAELKSKKPLVPEFERIKNFGRDFSRLMIRILDYETIEEFHMTSTFAHRLDEIKVPTFFLNAKDDPLFGDKVIPVGH